MDPAEFMGSVNPRPVRGNTPWADRYAQTIRQVVVEHSRRAPRSQQRHLGPSELGSECDRQVVGKMAGAVAVAPTNHVSDPWPSVVGTAVHAWLEEAFSSANGRWGVERFLTEKRVTPIDLHPGTGDLYDHEEEAVGDHKVLGVTSLAKVKRPEGPPRKYQVQLFLYGLGFLRMNLPVKRVALIAYPRTESSLDKLYVWEQPWTDEVEQTLRDVIQQTSDRTAVAELLSQGLIQFLDVPATPSQDECFFCPFYRPQGGQGCPGK